MPADILIPDDGTGAAIHHEVGPFIYKLYIVKGSLGKEGNERQRPDEYDTEDRQWVFPYKLTEFPHIYFE
jgi:hypothetical protein